MSGLVITEVRCDVWEASLLTFAFRNTHTHTHTHTSYTPDGRTHFRLLCLSKHVVVVPSGAQRST